MYLMPCLDCSDVARSASVHGVTASKWTRRPPPIRSTQYLPVGLTLRVRPKYCRVAPSRKKVTGLPTEVSTALEAEAVDAARPANADELAAVVTVAEVQGLFGDDTAAGLLPRLVALAFASRGGVPGKGSGAASTGTGVHSASVAVAVVAAVAVLAASCDDDASSSMDDVCSNGCCNCSPCCLSEASAVPLPSNHAVRDATKPSATGDNDRWLVGCPSSDANSCSASGAKTRVCTTGTQRPRDIGRTLVPKSVAAA